MTVGPSRKNFKEGPDLGSLLEGCSVSDLVEDGEWRFAGSGMEKQVNRGYKDGQRIRFIPSSRLGKRTGEKPVVRNGSGGGRVWCGCS